MTVRELTSCYWDKIKIYTDNGEEFEDLYKGSADYIPSKLLDRQVRSFGACRKGVLDVCVQQ